MLYASIYGQLGQQSPVETYENQFRWGPTGMGLITGGTINANATDPGNSPSYELRPGLLLGKKTADDTWTNYAAANTDGSEVACGVLLIGLRMQDILSGANTPKFYGVLVAGPVKAAPLIGLDAMARAVMSDHFMFDDLFNIQGAHWFPYRRFQNKTANYQVVASDNFTVFDNTGAAGTVVLTLPPIANGFEFALKAGAAQTFQFTSTEGANIIGDTLTRTSVSVANIGGGLRVYSNAAATKWYVENLSSGSQAVSYA